MYCNVGRSSTGIGLAVLALLMLGCFKGSTGEVVPCAEEEIEEQRLLEIADAYVQERRKWAPSTELGKHSIRRDGCDYVVTFQSARNTPGGTLIMRISEKGDVVDYNPGL